MKRRIWLVGLLAIVALLAGLVLPACGKSASTSQAGSAQATQSQGQDAASAESTTSAKGKESAASKSSASSAEQSATSKESSASKAAIDENGTYTSKEDVALYLHTYGHLPSNYVTKDEAEDAGWKTEGLSLSEACPGKSIGGDRFGNREGLLPSAKGRTWYECDIDYNGERSRNAKRIVYSSDGLVYYTEDHYESFEQLY